jgi:DNA-binding MarR family transcriptional regulator
MTSLIEGLNKHFDSRIRLGIMSALMVNDFVDFNTLKDLLKVTDGNLASHVKALEKNNLIAVQKQFVGRKPNTSFHITSQGKSAFQRHLDALEKLINNQ